MDEGRVEGGLVSCGRSTRRVEEMLQERSSVVLQATKNVFFCMRSVSRKKKVEKSRGTDVWWRDSGGAEERSFRIAKSRPERI